MHYFEIFQNYFMKYFRAKNFIIFYITNQGCVLAPDSFATGMDWLLDRTVEYCSIGVAFGQSSFTYLDFADDVSLLAELLELLVPILETIASEAASLGFEVNCQKTKVQESRSLSTLALLSTHQLEALVTSAAEFSSLVLLCRA